jgi:hypothetical protein
VLAYESTKNMKNRALKSIYSIPDIEISSKKFDLIKYNKENKINN